MTYLQRLLASDGLPRAGEVAAAAGVHRATVYRWQQGDGFPDREHAEALIALYRPLFDAGLIGRPLDFNGCYRDE